MSIKIFLGCLFFGLQFSHLHSDDIDWNAVNEIIARNELQERQDIAERIINGEETAYKGLRLAMNDPRYGGFRKMDSISLALMDKDQLRILRNTIFAQYGYAFKSGDLQKHFSQFDWYSPQFDNVDSQLTPKDLAVIQRIRQFENIDTNAAPPIEKSELTGVWHVAPHIAAGFHRVYQFFPDGRFTFHYSQMRELATFLSFAGRYEIRGNSLLLFAESRDILVHSDEVVLTGGWGYIWSDSRIETETFHRQYRFPIGGPVRKAGELYEEVDEMIQSMPIIEIGGTVYFHYSDDPDDYR